MKHLKRKGWTHHEIQKAEDILHSEEKRRKNRLYRQEMNRVLYWTTLLVLVVCNFLISIFLIPFLVVFKATFVFAVAATLGLAFGLLFNLLVTDIEHLESRHHLFALFTIPILGILDFGLVIGISNSISEVLAINITHEPLLVSVFYVVPFLIPYLYTTVSMRWK